MDVAVGLVETYLRLNGYLTVTELQVQREQGRRFEAATDLDTLRCRSARPTGWTVASA